MTETREQMIARWEADGMLIDGCEGCGIFYDSPGMPWEVTAPRHKASRNCESGGYSHCSCDSCF